MEKESVGGNTVPTNDKRKDGRKKGPQHERKFATEVADVTGVTKRDVNKKIHRADKLGTDRLRRSEGADAQLGGILESLP